MHRLPVDTSLLDQDSPVLSKEASRHLKVLRPDEGERIELFDGKGAWRVYSYVSGGLVAAGPREFEPRPKRGTILFACVTKGSRWDWTVEKATELGVSEIVPVISERTIVRIPRAERAAKRERWLRIAEDAARQSDAKWIPEISEPLDFAEALARVPRTACLVGALTDPPSAEIGAALGGLADDPRPVATFIGPEGDFTPEELAALIAVGVPVSFGPRVLRAETAAIFAVSVIRSRYHE